MRPKGDDAPPLLPEYLAFDRYGPPTDFPIAGGVYWADGDGAPAIGGRPGLVGLWRFGGLQVVLCVLQASGADHSQFSTQSGLKIRPSGRARAEIRAISSLPNAKSAMSMFCATRVGLADRAMAAVPC